MFYYIEVHLLDHYTQSTSVLSTSHESPRMHQSSRLSMCNGPTNALVCNKTLIQMSHIKTFKNTPTCFDYQMIIIRELFDPG
jgi:hypothetical protein